MMTFPANQKPHSARTGAKAPATAKRGNRKNKPRPASRAAKPRPALRIERLRDTEDDRLGRDW
jgi:hypothetical protein